MSVQFSNDPHQVVQIEQENNIQTIKRVLSREERVEIGKVRRIFNKYDINRDGFLSKKDLKKLIEQNPCECMDLPKNVAKNLLKMHDDDKDGKLDFEEFLKLSNGNKWIVHDWCVKYCKYVIPPRDKGPVNKGSTDSMDDKDGDGSFEEEISFYPPPITMIIFSIIEVMFFIIDAIYFKDESDDLNQVKSSTSGPMARLFIYNTRKRKEVWRFFTYMFVHVNVTHLIANLVIQIFVGTFHELVNSWWQIVVIYLAGVLAGSMGTSISNPLQLAGASGGVYALITAHIATIFLNWHEMKTGFIQLIVFLLFCGYDIGTSIQKHMADPNDSIGYMAHLCGGLAGILVGIAVLRNLKKRPYEKKVWWLAVTIYFILMISGVCFHIFNSDYFRSPIENEPLKSGL